MKLMMTGFNTLAEKSLFQAASQRYRQADSPVSNRKITIFALCRGMNR